MTEKEKRTLYESIMKQISKEVKHIIENKFNETAQKNALKYIDSFEIFSNLINSKTTEEIKNKRKQIIKTSNDLTKINESAEDVLSKIICGKSPIGKINFSEIAERTVDVAFGSADMLTNDTLDYIELINKDIVKFFKFENWQMRIVRTKDRVEYIDFVIPSERPFYDNFIEFMKENGFYHNDAHDEFVNYLESKGRNSVTEEEEEILLNWTLVRFLPFEQEDMRKDLHKIGKYLYHITLKKYLNDIMTNGLIPRNFSHPDYPRRVFMILPNRYDRDDFIDIETQTPVSRYIQALKRRLIQYNEVAGKHVSDSDFVILKIDTTKLPDDLKMHFDTPSYPYAIYTTSKIPAEAITL